MKAAAEAPEVEEYEIKPEVAIIDETTKKQTRFFEDELESENLEDEFEGEDVDENIEGTNDDGNAEE
jgi:hypothetical protein